MKKYEELTYKDIETPRFQRARRTSNTILSLMRDFIPQDRDCLRKIEDHLTRLAYESNTAFVNVPPEWDEFDKLQIERAMLENKMQVAGGPGAAVLK